MKKSKVTYSAFDTAAYYITFKDRTEKEIKDKLKEKGYSSCEIDESITKLKEYGYLNDENYTLSYIKSNKSKKGAKLISMELAQKGISKETISEQLEEVVIDEVGAIEEVLLRRYRDLDFCDEGQKRRVYSYFLRRGFRHEAITKAIRNYKNN